MNQELLLIRNKLKDKKPEFLRQDAGNLKRVDVKWHAPKGIHSKMRKKLRGYRRQPSIGWSSPKKVRGLTPDGYKVILVQNPNQLENIKDPITISSAVGLKKKLEIIKRAQELKIKILNVKDPESLIKRVEELRKEKKAKTKVKEEQKKKLVEEAEKKVKEKKEEIPEEREKREKAEKRKVLEAK